MDNVRDIYSYVDEYMNYNFTDNKNRSNNTKVSYLGKLREFADILTEIKGKNFDVSTITFDDLQGYVDILRNSSNHPYIKNGRNNSASSVINKLTVAKIFIKFLRKKRVLKMDITRDEFDEKIQTDRVVKNEIRYLSKEECEQILANIEWKGSSANSVYDSVFNSIRNYTMMIVHFSTGLRRFELLNLKRNNIVNNGIESTLFVKGKGRKDRSIPLNESAEKTLNIWINYLDSYLQKKHKTLKDEDLLFPSNRGQVITEGDYWWIVEKAFKTIGRGAYLTDENGNYILDENGDKIKNPNKLSSHAIRKGFATFLNEQGASSFIIQSLLGHASITTTEKYTAVSFNTKREAVNKINLNFNISQLNDKK